MKARVLFVGHDTGRGLSHTLTPQAVALRPIAEAAGIKLHVASVSNEMEPGLWDRLRTAFPSDCIHELDNEVAALSSLGDEMAKQNGPLIFDVHGIRSLNAVKYLRAANRSKVGIVYQVHSYRNTTWRRPFYALATCQLLKRHVDFVLFPSMDAATSLLFSKSLRRDGRVGIIPEGLKSWPADPPVPGPDALGGAANRAILLDPTLFKFLSIAHFKAGKGHRWLVEAFTPVLKQYPQARLVLAGAPQDQLLFDSITQQARQRGVDDQVVFIGRVDNVNIPWLCETCDAGVIASTSETFGRNYLEPMKAGAPVIATRHGIGPSVVIDYDTGISMADHDTLGLQKAAAYLLDDFQRAEQMGQNAKALVDSLFSWERSANALVGAYQGVLMGLAKA